MRLLHTADWHVGKTIRGASRAVEHESVLAEIVEVARRGEVDVVAVVGDLFDTAAPTAESERIVYRALLDLAGDGRQVVVVCGNHDNARRLAAVAPVFDSARIHVAAHPAAPSAGGVLSLEVAGAGLEVALLPFLSQRHVVGVDELMSGGAAEHAQTYDERVRRILAALCEGWASPAAARKVRIIVAHAHVAGGSVGGGERSAHTIFDYAVSPLAFPVTAAYVALGHLHRTQRIDGPCPIWYPGSPIQLDFGEVQQSKHVLVVDLEPGLPAKVEQVPLEEGTPLRVLTGSLADLRAASVEGPVHLRVVVEEPQRVGLAEEVRSLFPDAVEIRIEAGADHVSRAADRHGPVEARSPSELFSAYLAERGIADEALEQLFAELLEEASTGAAGGEVG